MLKNLLKHFSKKKEDEKKTQTFQPLYRKHDRIINQQLAKDILLGTAIGDALGFPVQFIPRETVQKDPVIGMGKCRTFESPSGIWSDDTSLSLCLADSLCSGYNLRDIASKFIEWLFEGLWTPNNKAFDIGITTMQAISNLRNRIEPKFAGLNGEKDNGNGSLMRIAPLIPYIYGLVEEQQIQIISEVSSLTHRHPRSILACIFLCKFAIQYLATKEIPTAFAYTQKEIKYLLTQEKFKNECSHFDRLVNLTYEQFRNIAKNDIKSTGYVIDTLEASLWSVFNHDSFKDSVLCAVNLGYDADTVGAITGALAGIIYGHDSIPEEWLNVLARKEDIIELANKLDSAIKSNP